MKGIGKQTIKALETIRDAGSVSPKQFSELMWPDAEGHTVPGSCGYGVTNGIGMWKAAGSFLGKLRRKGLITNDNALSDFGALTLKERRERKTIDAYVKYAESLGW